MPAGGRIRSSLSGVGDDHMTPEAIPLSPATRSALDDLVARTGRPADLLLAEAVEEYRRKLGAVPVAAVPGVNPADVWEAYAEAQAGRLTAHDEVFARLRNRS